MNLIELCDIDENGQLNKTCLKTVGGVYHRYRLVHRWVPEMVLNVQSNSLIEKCFIKYKSIFLFLGPYVIFPYKKYLHVK